VKLCGFDAGLDFPFFLIAGTCVIESEQLAIETAGQLQEICARLDIPFIYKSSFDKANRSSGTRKACVFSQRSKGRLACPC